MNDMSAVILPRSDQLNADSLLGGPMTITVSKVEIRPGTEQPVSIHFDGDEDRPYKPCKSMCRVMVHCWGADANQYVGRSMTLYCDPKVTWGGMAVGGIRISHMTDINGTQVMALTATKGSKKPFTVKPLKVEAAPVAIDAEKLAAFARTVASSGVAAYQTYWASLTKEQKTALLPHHEELKATAKAADEPPPASDIENDPTLTDDVEGY
jgi:hypothetical protein